MGNWYAECRYVAVSLRCGDGVRRVLVGVVRISGAVRVFWVFLSFVSVCVLIIIC